MLSWRAQWSDWQEAYEEVVSTPEAAVELVKRVSRTTAVPTMVEFFNDSGTALCIGTGRPVTVLTYQKSNDPPYFISLGGPDTSGTEWFCYGREESEYMARNLVDLNSGLAALTEFVSTGARPAAVAWEAL